MADPQGFHSKAKKWAAENDLHGPSAFLRYVMFRFVENLNRESNDFVLKGGNLLWVYIHTPRATIDLDFATLKSSSDKAVRTILARACKGSDEITYIVQSFKRVSQNGKSGAAVSLSFETNEGAKNQFDLDIVYELETDIAEVQSPIDEEVSIRSASIENIIVDKFSACVRFGSGNTRMKDYDDLWRLSRSKFDIDTKRLASLLKTRKTSSRLDLEWIEEGLERGWANHRRRYPDLPKKLQDLFEDVNQWILTKI